MFDTILQTIEIFAYFGHYLVNQCQNLLFYKTWKLRKIDAATWRMLGDTSLKVLYFSRNVQNKYNKYVLYLCVYLY